MSGVRVFYVPFINRDVVGDAIIVMDRWFQRARSCTTRRRADSDSMPLDTWSRRPPFFLPLLSRFWTLSSLFSLWRYKRLTMQNVILHLDWSSFSKCARGGNVVVSICYSLRHKVEGFMLCVCVCVCWIVDWPSLLVGGSASFHSAMTDDRIIRRSPAVTIVSISIDSLDINLVSYLF